MANTDLYIIAAGNGSRMQANVPKALVPIAEEPNLTTTLQQVKHKFTQVFVVTNISVQEQWQSYFQGLQVEYPELATKVFNVPIRSGFGDGHATLQGVLAAECLKETTPSQDVVITWGDAFFPNGEIIDELLQILPKGSGIVPATRESNPYVALVVDEKMQCVSADFSKYGERHSEGLHDQSVFRFSLRPLKASLWQLHNALWKNGRYIAPGGELSLLHSFHQLYNKGDPAHVYETEFPTLSFNTIEDVAAIQREIRVRWEREFRGDMREA
jgi:NDP-sugar pyrophosphorylase family protein